MDDMQTKVAETEQEHLRGGQESPDMEVFREQWRENVAMNDLINAVGGLCTQLFILVDTLIERNTLTEQTNRLLTDIKDDVNNISSELNTTEETPRETFASKIAAIADDFHSTLYEDVSMKINTGLDNYAESVADALYTENGDGICESVDRIGADIGCVCDSQTDHKMKVYVSGELANYPQPY